MIISICTTRIGNGTTTKSRNVPTPHDIARKIVPRKLLLRRSSFFQSRP